MPAYPQCRSLQSLREGGVVGGGLCIHSVFTLMYSLVLVGLSDLLALRPMMPRTAILTIQAEQCWAVSFYPHSDMFVTMKVAQ